MAYGTRNSVGDLHDGTPSEHQQATHGHNHVTVPSGRGQPCAIDRRVHLAVDEIPERSDLVCVVTFAKLEAINNFEADRVYLCLKCREISIETVSSKMQYMDPSFPRSVVDIVHGELSSRSS